MSSFPIRSTSLFFNSVKRFCLKLRVDVTSAIKDEILVNQQNACISNTFRRVKVHAFSGNIIFTFHEGGSLSNKHFNSNINKKRLFSMLLQPPVDIDHHVALQITPYCCVTTCSSRYCLFFLIFYCANSVILAATMQLITFLPHHTRAQAN